MCTNRLHCKGHIIWGKKKKNKSEEVWYNVIVVAMGHHSICLKRFGQQFSNFSQQNSCCCNETTDILLAYMH